MVQNRSVATRIHKHMELSIERPEQLFVVTRALASETRIQIMRLINEQSLNVNEIAAALTIPVSTAAMHVKTLEEAKLITAELQPGVRGAMKLCSRRVDSASISLLELGRQEMDFMKMSMPVGGFTACQIHPTCGIISDVGYIGLEDSTRSFLDQNRFSAQLLWFRHGYVEYSFQSIPREVGYVRLLECSFEACSEAPYYRNDWPSDITVWINHIELDTWTCPGDFGGRRGRNNPDWWPDTSTQYGMFKTWRIDDQGVWLDGVFRSQLKLDELKLQDNDAVTLRIGVKDSAEHMGGINLFGQSFGDYAQDVELKLGYCTDNSKETGLE